MTGLMVALAPSAAAADDYPFPNAVDCSGTFGQYSWCVNGNWYSPRKFAYRNCTDFVAYRLAQVNGVDFHNNYGGRTWSHANNWDNTARALNIPVNNTPAVGAIAQTDAGNYGHVAWVSAVGSGTVTIEEYNWGGTGRYNTRTVPTSTFVYIHIKDLPTNLPFGHLDLASSPQPNEIRVGGWAIDPDGPTAALSVHVYVRGPAGGGGSMACALPANLSRKDVGAAHPGTGENHGFDGRCTAPTGTYPVCVHAINIGAGTDNPVIGCKTVTVEDGAPFGHYDSASSPSSETVAVSGWAIDRNGPTTPLKIHIYRGGPAGQGGTYVTEITADRDRTDVAAVHPWAGTKHGFSQVVSVPAGTYPVCVYAINIGPDTGNIGLGCKSVTVKVKPKPTFSDVPASSAFFTEIEWAVKAGITSGYSNGTFKPTASINRDAVAAMLWRAMNPSKAKPTCSSKPFTDVATTHQFCGEIAWMKSRGITKGNANGTYGPGEAVSRQAIAAFLARAWGPTSLPACNPSLFTDVGSSHPFCKEITWMKQQGISSGWKVGSKYEFRPAASIERQAFVTFLHRKFA